MYSGRDHAKAWGCPIRKSADQRLLSPPRSLSQSATSFFASWCLGIHQMPLRRLLHTNSLISIDQLQPRPETNGPQTTTRTNLYPKGHVQYHASDKDKVTRIPYRLHTTRQIPRQQPRNPTDNATDSTEPVLSLLQINHDKEQPRAPLPARAELEEASLLQDRGSGREPPLFSGARLVGPGRFELPTSRLSSARSNQLSYEPMRRSEAPDRRSGSRVSDPAVWEGMRGRRGWVPGLVLAWCCLVQVDGGLVRPVLPSPTLERR